MRSIVKGAGFLLVAAQCGGAVAQVADEPANPAGVEEIVVTARKKAERLQDAPISITAFSADAMARTGVQTIADVARKTPGLQYGDYGDLKLSPTSLRGIVGGSGTAGSDPAVGYYVDDVFVGQGAGANLDLYDIERVEILRGPQGTLYGRNTIGGVIAITTKRPSETFEGSVQLDLGNYDAVRLAGSLSGPIVPGAVYAKLAVIRDRRDGFEYNELLDRRVNNDNDWSVRGQLRFDIAPATDLLITADYRRADNQPLVFETLSYTEGSSLTRLLAERGLARNAKPFDRVVQSDIVTRETLDAYGVAATFRTRIGAVGVTNILSYRKHDYYSRTDTDRSPLEMIYDGDPEKVWRVSEELRFDVTTGPIDWLFGLYYFKQSTDNQSFTEIGRDLADLFEAPELAGIVAGSTGKLKTTSKAAFVSATWKLSDRLDVTLGGRYTHDSKTIDYIQNDPAGILGGDADIDAKGGWGQFTPNANVRYRFTPDLLGYVTVSKGFKSGGFNDGLGEANGISFDPETLWNYEAGLKASLFDRRLIANAAVYYMKWDNIQIAQDNPATPVFDPITLNGGAAHSKGIELEITARPTERLQLQANMSVQEAVYEAGTLSTGLKLDRIPLAPSFTGLISADYRIPLGWGSLSLFGEYTRRGSMYLNADNSPEAHVSYGLFNARITLAGNDQRWSVALWGKNLTNRTYKQRLFDLSDQDFIAQKFIVLGAPRTFGVSTQFKF